ncbi:MAG: hypothetical protein M3235_00035 [Actinomycetota bacterium]|nr:hypothetical protein [Actinomycetota bacterium]
MKMPSTVATRRARASAGTREAERERQNIHECLDQGGLHHRGRHVRDSRFQHRAVAPSHGAREQDDHDGHGVFRQAARAADGGRIHPGGTEHRGFGGQYDDEPAPPARADPDDEQVGRGHPGQERSQGCGRPDDRPGLRDAETEQQDVPGGEGGEGVPQPEERDRIDRRRGHRQGEEHHTDADLGSGRDSGRATSLNVPAGTGSGAGTSS